MARPKVGQVAVITEANWTKGIIRDSQRASIPDGGVYDAMNFLVHRPGVAQKRGGTGYAGPVLTSSTWADRVSYAEFPAGNKLCAIGSNNHFYTVTSGTTTDVGATAAAFLQTGPGVDSMKLFSGGSKNLLVIPACDGATAPKVYNGSTLANLGGTPPGARFVTIHASRIVFANGTVSGTAYPARIWFSPTPDPETAWDTANSWIDVGHPITGIASLQNTLLIFSHRHCQRLTGTTPPPGTNMVLEPVGSVGAPDARAIIVQDSTCIFANTSGVYLTNGVGFQNLTREGGIESWWRETLADYATSGGSVLAMGIYARSFLFVTYRNPSGLFPFGDTLMCYLPTRSWVRVINVYSHNYASSAGAADELYYADAAAARVTTLSGIFTPAAANKNDADGDAIHGILITRPLGTGTGVKHFMDGRVTYDLTDAGTDNPIMTVGSAPGINAVTFVDELSAAETSAAVRQRFTVGRTDQVCTLRLSEPQASSKCEIYSVELEQRPLSPVEGGAS